MFMECVFFHDTPAATKIDKRNVCLPAMPSLRGLSNSRLLLQYAKTVLISRVICVSTIMTTGLQL